MRCYGANRIRLEPVCVIQEVVRFHGRGRGGESAREGERETAEKMDGTRRASERRARPIVDYMGIRDGGHTRRVISQVRSCHCRH